MPRRGSAADRVWSGLSRRRSAGLPGPAGRRHSTARRTGDLGPDRAEPGRRPVVGGPALGIDVASVARVRELVLAWGAPAVDRLFTAAERDAASGRAGPLWDSLAGRFAAKEATKKVLGARGRAAAWTDIEVHRGGYGEPLLRLHGPARTAAAECGFSTFLLSISHRDDIAIAVVLAM